jgi:ABC-2 type transport system permease protein
MRAGGAFAWSIRRELWEHRAIVVAPAAIAALAIGAFAWNADMWIAYLRTLPGLDAARQARVSIGPYALVASLVLVTGWLIAIFYALDALHGERRDRSILFWKSMPVSDTTAVVAKAAVALVAIPLVALAIALAAQLVMLLVGSALLAWQGLDATLPWRAPPWLASTVALVYGLAAHMLWFAPIAGYLLLVSAAAPRMPLAWAVLPIVAAVATERVAFGTSHVATLLGHRLVGGMAAFGPQARNEPITSLAQLDPLGFLALPGLWLGLAFAAVCLALAIRLRRRREPH